MPIPRDGADAEEFLVLFFQRLARNPPRQPRSPKDVVEGFARMAADTHAELLIKRGVSPEDARMAAVALLAEGGIDDGDA